MKYCFSPQHSHSKITKWSFLLIQSLLSLLKAKTYISQIIHSKIILQSDHEEKGSATYILIYYLTKVIHTICFNENNFIWRILWSSALWILFSFQCVRYVNYNLKDLALLILSLDPFWSTNVLPYSFLKDTSSLIWNEYRNNR